MGQERPINALLPGFAQVHVFNSTRIKPSIPVYMPISMYLGVFAQNTPRSRVSACFHLPSTASIALHVLSKCQTRVWAMLRNPAYNGLACFGKTKTALRQRITRPIRLRGGSVSRDSSHHERPREEWIEIPVPVIV